MRGLGAALFGEIPRENGRVERADFDDKRALRTNERPATEVRIVERGEIPRGVGEPGTSEILPAVANAVFAATGVRLHKRPIAPDLLKT